MKPDLTTKVARYFLARKVHGKSKKQAQLDAGYSDGQHGQRIEALQEYQDLEAYYQKILAEHL